MTATIGVDIGGTFTDSCVVLDRRMAQGKAETTSYDLTVGILKSVEEAAGKLGCTPGDLLRSAESVRYSTTVGTNLLIERRGPRLGLITTRGFEKTIFIGRAHNWADGLSRQEKFDRARGRRPEPLIPQDLVVGILERIDRAGEIVVPLDPREVVEAVESLVDRGVRGIVVSLLWSFVNPAHEREVKRIILERYPEVYLGHLPVVLSSEVAPRIDEYKRTITAILHAYMRSGIEEHFLELGDALHERGYSRSMLVARNVGGVASAARTASVELYASGPVSGITGAGSLARLYGIPKALVTDMGGTSFDLGFVVDEVERIYELDPVLDRWRIALPIVASKSIGAGGGSIAWIDEFGKLRVGPSSAGAMPGPAAYERGGTEPTVTDADLVLGYIDPDYFLGGQLPLSLPAARRAIETRIAKPVGCSVEDAALAIRRLVDGVMGQEIHKETSLAGHDPREFVLFAFGGAAPVHCCDYAEYADVERILTFAFGSVFNAFGTLTMDLLHTYEQSRLLTLYDPQRVAFTQEYARYNDVADRLERAALEDLVTAGLDPGPAVLQLELDMIYARQLRPLRVVSPRRRIREEADVRAICEAFNQAYRGRFGRGAGAPETGIQVVGFKVAALLPTLKPVLLPEEPGSADPEEGRKGARPVLWSSGERVVTPVFDRSRLRPGHRIPGPALIESEDTICAVPEGWVYVMDRYWNGMLEKRGS
jgi:N-methylhydantoinase A/acetophenone carboxylase